jgi:hypothetical protein
MLSRDHRLLLPLALLALNGAVFGQEPTPSLNEEPHVAIPYLTLINQDLKEFETAPAPRSPRLRMFGMPSGFLAVPLGIEPDDDVPSDVAAPRSSDNDPLQVTLGMYNPYLDFRLPGDLSSLGYYKLHSQLQVVEQGSTSVCLNLQAYTPAGIQWGGVANGPTVVSPTVAWFQELGAGSALQGYVGQSIHANSRWQDNLSTNFQYGMALQYPLPGLKAQANQSVYVFVQALGRYRFDGATTDGHQTLWEVLPGLHWRCSDNCWMSLGVLHHNFLTCSWQF